MEKSVVEKVTKTLVDQAGNVGETFRRASNTVQEGMSTAKNAVKDGRDAVEDFIDDTARQVKRSPIQSILLSLTVGVAIGYLLGWGTSSRQA